VSTSDVKAKFDWRWVVGPAVMVLGYFVVEIFNVRDGSSFSRDSWQRIPGVGRCHCGTITWKGFCGALGGANR